MICNYDNNGNNIITVKVRWWWRWWWCICIWWNKLGLRMGRAPINSQYASPNLAWAIFEKKNPYRLFFNCCHHHKARHVLVFLSKTFDGKLWQKTCMYLFIIQAPISVQHYRRYNRSRDKQWHVPNTPVWKPAILIRLERNMTISRLRVNYQCAALCTGLRTSHQCNVPHQQPHWYSNLIYSLVRVASQRSKPIRP